MSKHTPRPWKFHLKNAKNGFIVSAKDNQLHICDVYMTNDQSVAEDRARLIAAAPDLLAACKEALAHFEPICDQRKDAAVLDWLQAAIQKAEGL